MTEQTDSEPQTGYGTGGFGEGTYGDVATPTIVSLSLTRSEPLGSDRMLTARWTVEHDDNALDTIELTAVDTADVDMAFDVTNTSGGHASGWSMFQFQQGTPLTISLKATTTDGKTTTTQKTITL